MKCLSTKRTAWRVHVVLAITLKLQSQSTKVSLILGKTLIIFKYTYAYRFYAVLFMFESNIILYSCENKARI
jgi:hypothetical protein